MSDKLAAEILVTGRVQGVFFRATARDRAASLGLSGYVRNCPDGSVELHAEGERENIEKMVAWCHQGPPAASVQEVRVRWLQPSGEHGFRISW